MSRRGAQVVLDTEGEPLRRGLEAEPWAVSPNQHEAEQLVGQELQDDDDFIWAMDAIAEMGARNVQITLETGCFALVREERTVRRYRALAPQLEPVSVVGAGDALLAQWIAARSDGVGAEEALRHAVAAGAASVLEVGGGRFDPAEAKRLAAAVEVHELQAVVRSRRRAASPADAVGRLDAPGGRSRRQVREGRPHLRRRAAGAGRVGVLPNDVSTALG